MRRSIGSSFLLILLSLGFVSLTTGGQAQASIRAKLSPENHCKSLVHDDLVSPEYQQHLATQKLNRQQARKAWQIVTAFVADQAPKIQQPLQALQVRIKRAQEAERQLAESNRQRALAAANQHNSAGLGTATILITALNLKTSDWIRLSQASANYAQQAISSGQEISLALVQQAFDEQLLARSINGATDMFQLGIDSFNCQTTDDYWDYYSDCDHWKVSFDVK